MRAFFPGSAALLGHITRPGESAETMLSLIIEDRLAEPALSFRRAQTGARRLISASAHGAERQASVKEGTEKERVSFGGLFLKAGIAITQSALGLTQRSPNVTLSFQMARPDHKLSVTHLILPTQHCLHFLNCIRGFATMYDSVAVRTERPEIEDGIDGVTSTRCSQRL